MMIEVKHLEKKYRSKIILKDVSFFCDGGCCVGIIGPNGCGKSTLLSILAGILKTKKGEIMYFGENAGKNNKVFSRYVGYVPQDNPLMPELTVRDNLKLWYAGSERSLNDDLKEGILFELGIHEFIKKKVKHLSGGMKKKVSIACAMAKNVPVLIMDEPGAALDLPSKQDIQRYIRKFADEGGIVIIASHEESELSVCDKIYALKDGMLHLVEKNITTEEMIEKYFQK